MSGTSVDGIDAAVVCVGGSGRTTTVAVEGFVTHPMDGDLRQRVLDLSHGTGNAEEVSRVGFLLGAAFGDAVQAALDVAAVSARQVDAIASHGQTISHTAPVATLQIGEAAVLAQRFGVPVVSDFRTADVAAGGQGAPLVPYADWCLLTHPTKSRAIQNIGGIGNVTYLPANALPGQVIGFDTGPGNMLIDRAAQWATDGALTFDRDGQIAAAGKIDYTLLSNLLDHPLLLAKPPKSFGREQFGEAFFESILRYVAQTDEAEHAPLTTWCGAQVLLEPQPRHGMNNKTVRETLVATLTAFTALSIADAYERFLPSLPDEVILGGGGARNPTLVRMLREQFKSIPVLMHEDVCQNMGMNSENKEAVAFALLANETLLGVPSNLPSVTGATCPVIQGKLTLPPPP